VDNNEHIIGLNLRVNELKFGWLKIERYQRSKAVKEPRDMVLNTILCAWKNHVVYAKYLEEIYFIGDT
jgi:hypothetical protein